MSEAQAHDPALVPFGAHNLPAELLPNADLRARLLRKSVGADEAEADALIDVLPAEIIRSESDALLADRVKAYRKDGPPFDPAAHSIKDVLAHVDGDPQRARDILAAERAETGKDRTTLVAKLEELVAADQVNTPPVVASAPGDSADAGGDAGDGPHV